MYLLTYILFVLLGFLMFYLVISLLLNIYFDKKLQYYKKIKQYDQDNIINEQETKPKIENMSYDEKVKRAKAIEQEYKELMQSIKK
ncbi:MAG: hypothetical protein ACK5HR_05050 [Mycoplasmatales bacterium]